MKLFFWQRLNHMTDNWHHEGAAIVIADSLERAVELLPSKGNTCRCNDCKTEPSLLPKNAQVRLVLTVGNKTLEQVLIIPDRGCC